MTDLVAARRDMVERQLVARGIRDPAVLAAMLEVPRDVFVAPGMGARAYQDGPLSIGEGQTISQPYIVALMIEAATLRRDDRVLEVGAGSGYAAAVLGRLVERVHAIERHAVLAAQAQARFDALGYDNIVLRIGDGTRGWIEGAPFDAIVVSAGTSEVPRELCAQLAIGGRMVIPIGRFAPLQRLLRITRRGEHAFDETDLGGVSFVPLVADP